MNEILIILRALIQDIDGSIYTDDSLNRLIITSAIVVQQDAYFEQAYTIDISSLSITPDPTDNSFILFCAYKAAILLIQSEIRKYSTQSFKIVDGPSTVDLTNSTKDLKILLDSLLEQYDRLIKDYTRTQNVGYVITTPTTAQYVSVGNF